jgi:hypothetical protein
MKKHSSFLRKFVNYGRKKIYNIGSWSQYYKTSYGRNLQMFTELECLLDYPGKAWQGQNL